MLTCLLQIQLKAEDLYDKDKGDLETVVLDVLANTSSSLLELIVFAFRQNASLHQ